MQMRISPETCRSKSKRHYHDQQIALKDVDEPLRLVAYTDQDSNKEYHFITNAHHLKASEISAIYKERW